MSKPIYYRAIELQEGEDGTYEYREPYFHEVQRGWPTPERFALVDADAEVAKLQADLTAARQRIEKLIAAALPVIERWDHGSGMDGVLIDALREAVGERANV